MELDIIRDICIENLQQLQAIYVRLKHNFPAHKDLQLWAERQAYWTSINPLKKAFEFETEGELREYILTYSDELEKIEAFEIIAMLPKKDQFLS
jgi:hypothetical protein